MVYLKLGIMATIALILLALSLFLYGEFYQTIVQARAVLVLKQEVALEDVELEAFNRVQALHEYKQSKILPAVLPNPFETAGGSSVPSGEPSEQGEAQSENIKEQFPTLFQ